jgi:tRNA threonylcarbamoyladenosine biosynthesis protein TsaE
MSACSVVRCGPRRADEVHRLTQAAFGPYRHLDPPPGAGRESVAQVAEDLAAGGGAIAQVEGQALGCLRWLVEPDGDFRVRRVAVEPALQRQGIGRALMAWAEEEAPRHGCGAVSVGVRIALPGNLAFYRELGYEVTSEERHDGHDRTTGLAMRKGVRRC